MDVPLEHPNIDPIGPLGLESWDSSAQKLLHFWFNLIALMVVLFVIPYIHRQQALELGLLTPWKLFKLSFFIGADDPYFL